MASAEKKFGIDLFYARCTLQEEGITYEGYFFTQEMVLKKKDWAFNDGTKTNKMFWQWYHSWVEELDEEY